MSTHFLSRTGIETEVNVTAGFCLGLAYAMGFTEGISSSFAVGIDSVTYLSTPFTILTQEAVLSSSRDGWIDTVSIIMIAKFYVQAWADFLVFLEIHPLIRVPFSFRGIVNSRHRCCICCPSSVSWVLKCRRVSTSFKPAKENSLDNFWSSDKCSNFRSYSCTRFPRCCALVEVSEFLQ